MVTPLVLPNGPDVLVADAEVMGALVPCAPFRWRWNDGVDTAVDGAEEIALRLMRAPSLKMGRPGGSGNDLPPRRRRRGLELPLARRFCRLMAAWPASPACLSS
jgi:hypothetical protein